MRGRFYMAECLGAQPENRREFWRKCLEALQAYMSPKAAAECTLHLVHLKLHKTSEQIELSDRK